MKKPTKLFPCYWSKFSESTVKRNSKKIKFITAGPLLLHHIKLMLDSSYPLVREDKCHYYQREVPYVQKNDKTSEWSFAHTR